MILDPAQEDAVARMVAEPARAALNSSLMGRGKTVMSCMVAERIGAKNILVVAPLGTRTGWLITFERQQSPLEFHWINSTVKGKAALALYLSGAEGIFFVGIELFTRMGLKDNRSTNIWAKIVPDMAVIDEVHKGFSNRKSKAFRVLKTLNAGYRMACSGTPSGNFAQGQWSVTRWVFPDHTDSSFARHVEEFYITEYDPFSFSHQRIVAERQPSAYLNSMPCYLRLEREDNVQSMQETIYVDLSAKQRSIYNQMEKDLVAWLGDNPLISEVPVVKRTRMRQITLGVPEIREDGVVDFPANTKSSKLEALDGLIADELQGESALILMDSQKFAVRTAERLEAAGHTVARWDGTVSQSKREEAKAAFVRGEVRFIVGVVAAVGEGVDLLQNGTRNIIFLSHSDSGILGEQAYARINRPGQQGVVRRWDIEALDTLDTGQFNSLIQQRLNRAEHLRVAA